MDTNDNPAPIIGKLSTMPTPSQIIQQVNYIFNNIKLSQPFSIDSTYIDKIFPYIENFKYMPRLLYIIYESEGKFIFSREAFNKKKFVQILIFWLGEIYYKNLHESNNKNKKERNDYKENKLTKDRNGSKRDKKPHTALSKLITKLYILKYLTLDDIEIISKFLLTLSLFHRKDIGSIENKVIKNEFYIRWAFTLLHLCFIDYPKREELTNEEVQMLINFIHFFKENFVCEDNMLFFTNQSQSSYSLFNLVYFLKLTQSKELKIEIIKLLSSIYIFRYSQHKCFAPMVYLLKDCLVNFDQKDTNQIKKDLDYLSCPIMFLQNQFEVESVESKKDQLMLDNAFYFNNKNCGILCSSIHLTKEHKTYIFSFNLVPNKEHKEYTIFTFYDFADINNHTPLKFSLEKNDNKTPGNNDNIHTLNDKKLKDKEREKNDPSLYKMFLTLKNKTIDLDIYIIPKKTYLFVVEHNNQNITINYTHHIQNNIVRNDTEVINIPIYKYSSKCSNTLMCLIGCTFIEPISSKNNDELLLETESSFSGYMGPVIIIDNQLSKDFVRNILNLKGKYEHILYFGAYDLSGLYKYFYEDTTLDYSSAKMFFEDSTSHLNEDFIKKIKLYVCPNNFQLIKTYNMYDKSYNIAMEKKQYKVVNVDYLGFMENAFIKGKYRISNGFHQKFHIVRNALTLFQFIKFDGINYISLLLEYYYQILIKIQKNESEKEKKEIFDQM